MNIVLANDTRGSVPGEHWGSWLTTTNLETLLARANLTIVDRLPLGKLQPVDSVWRRIERTGMLVINGEGSVHSGRPTAIALLTSLKVARERNLPVWIVNHGCWNCGELMPMYRFADFIAVRDIASNGYLAQHGIAARQAADCSFLSAPASAERQNQLLVCSGLQPPENRLVEQWASQLHCTRVIWCNDFYPRFSGVGAVKSGSAEESFRLFAASRFVISSSYHGCIFAAIHATPFLPIAVPGQPPKTMVAAIESMGHHVHGMQSQGPTYVNAHYLEIQELMQQRAAWLRRRAAFNIPAQSNRN